MTDQSRIPHAVPPVAADAGERQTYWLVFNPRGVPRCRSLAPTREESMWSTFGLADGWTCREIDFARLLPTGTGDADVVGLLDAFRDGVIANEEARGSKLPTRIDAFQSAQEARQAIEREIASLKARNAELERERDEVITSRDRQRAFTQHELEKSTAAETRAEAAEARVRELEKMLTPAAFDVLAERRRQVEVEGWTSEHDDGHDKGELAFAAAAYARHAGSDEDARQVNSGFAPEDLWPQHWMASWRPSSSDRDLVKAGALILAEIERRYRALLRATTPDREDGR